MPKSNTLISDWLNLFFKNTDATGWGDAGGLRGSAVAGNLYASLHTAAPGVGGTQATSEVSYTGYARVPVVRGAGFTVAGSPATAVLAALAAFGIRTNGGATIEATFFAYGADLSGAGKLAYYGPLTTGDALAGTGKASDDTITIPGSSYAVDDRVVFTPAAQSALPAGISADTVYWVKTASGTAITISTTQGGATLDITADGALIAQKLSTIVIAQNTIPQLLATTKIIDL